MQLADPISIRLSVKLYKKYEMEAALSGIPLRTYIRNRLEESDSIHQQLESIRSAIYDSQTSNSDSAVMLEMLLLLRQIAQPQRVNLAQQELKRLGYSIWSSDESRD